LFVLEKIFYAKKLIFYQIDLQEKKTFSEIFKIRTLAMIFKRGLTIGRALSLIFVDFERISFLFFCYKKNCSFFSPHFEIKQKILKKSLLWIFIFLS